MKAKTHTLQTNSLQNGMDKHFELKPVYVYINVHSMYRRSTISTMILDNTCVIFQCMKLLHVNFRISKMIKLSRCKYMKILPGFLHNWAVRTRVFCCDSAEE